MLEPDDSASKSLPEPASSEPESWAQIFWRWELLRLVFNAVLLGLMFSVLLVTGLWRGAGEGWLSSMLIWFVLMNILYLAGASLQWVLLRIGMAGTWLTGVLFCMGTLLAAFLTLIRLFTISFARVAS